MDRKQLDRQIAFVKAELTRLSQDLAFSDGQAAQALIVRQRRLAAELERLEPMARQTPSQPPPRR